MEWLNGETDGDFPVLECLRIRNCPKLTSIPNFVNLRSLEIIRCSFSKLELNLLQSQLLESLLIEECIEITLLQGLQSLNSLQSLCIFRCPLLSEFLSQKMPNSPVSIEIVECPSLNDWCQIQQFNYIEVYLTCLSLLNLKHRYSAQIFILFMFFWWKFLLFNNSSYRPGFLLQDISHFW